MINIVDVLETIGTRTLSLTPSSLTSTDNVFIRCDNVIYKINNVNAVHFFMKKLKNNNICPHDAVIYPNWKNIDIAPHILTTEIDNVKKIDDVITNLKLKNVEKIICGNYYVWLNITIASLAWYLFVYKICDSTMFTIPLPHHKNLGNICLIKIKSYLNKNEKIRFLNIEMQIYNETKQQIVYQNCMEATMTTLIIFTLKKTDTLHLKYGQNLVVCHPNNDVFHFIKYNAHTFRTIETKDTNVNMDLYDLTTMSTFEPTIETCRKTRNKNLLPFAQINAYVKNSVAAIKNITEICELLEQDVVCFLKEMESKNVYENASGLCPNMTLYLHNSRYSTLDYLFSYVLQKLDFNITETANVRFVISSLCNILHENTDLENQKQICLEHLNVYNNLDFTLTLEFANQFVFENRDLAAYFALHIETLKLNREKISSQNIQCYNMTSSDVAIVDKNRKVSPIGWFVVIQANGVNVVFNDKHYEIFNKSSVSKSSTHNFAQQSCHVRTRAEIKFNCARYAYATVDGVFNTLTNKFVSHGPFLLSNCMLKTFAKPDQNFIVPKSFFEDMFATSHNDKLMLGLYHVAKMCRDVRELRLLTSLNVLFNDTIDNALCQKKLQTHVRVLLTMPYILQLALIYFSCDNVLTNIMDERLLLYEENVETAALFCLCSTDQNDIIYILTTPSNDIEELKIKVETNNIFSTFLNNTLAYKPTHSKKNCNNNEKLKREFDEINSLLRVHNVWADKMLVASEFETLQDWLFRFYVRVIFSKFEYFDNVSNHQDFISIAKAYIFLNVSNNFNHENVKFWSLFLSSLAICHNYEKMAVCCIGTSNAGKSYFCEIIHDLVSVYQSKTFKLDPPNANSVSTATTLSAKSQLIVFEEQSIIPANTLKKLADSSKVVVSRVQHEPDSSMMSLHKMIITANSDPIIKHFDNAIANRLIIIRYNHQFTNSLFSKSAYEHFALRTYPDDKLQKSKIVENLKLYLSYILLYFKNSNNGLIESRNAVTNTSIQNNIRAVAIKNNALRAFNFVTNLKISPGFLAFDSLNLHIIAALSHVQQICFAARNIDKDELLSLFVEEYSNHWCEEKKGWYNIVIGNSDDWNKNIQVF